MRNQASVVLEESGNRLLCTSSNRKSDLSVAISNDFASLVECLSFSPCGCDVLLLYRQSKGYSSRAGDFLAVVGIWRKES